MKQSSLVKTRTNNDIFFTILMAMVWSESILLRYIRVLLMNVPYIWKHADMIISVVYVILFCFAIFSAVRCLYVNDLLYFLLLYGVFYIYYVLYPLNRSYYILYGDTLTKEVLPMFLLGICVYRVERERTLKLLSTLSLITVYAFVGYMLLFANLSGRIMRAGDMHAAYLFLPHLCMVFGAMLRKPGPWNIVAFIIGTIMLLFLGNRGSLLCLGCFAIFSVLFSGKLKRPILFLVLSVLVMAILFLFGLLDLLYDLAEKYDFSLRIFQKLDSGEITNTSGRDKISDRVWEYIMLNPVFGMGIYSDRRVAGGRYAHNIVLEFMIHYGIFLGIVLLLLLIYMYVKGYWFFRKTGDEHSCDFLSMLFFSCFLKLLLSSSYLLEPYFFFAIGFGCAALHECKKTLLPEDKKAFVRLRRTL